MKFLAQLFLVLVTCSFWACSETENPNSNLNLDFQPLEVGLYWKYEVSETIVFGENDMETQTFFYRDIIEYDYRNAEKQQVFVLSRDKSPDGIIWVGVGNYALQMRGNALVRTFDNQSIVNLVFPPKLGLKWESGIYAAMEENQFSIDLLGPYNLNNQNYPQSLRVLHQNADDEITFRDNRYEIFAKGIGLIEQYYEVYTYCSRNDCLGDKIIDSGRLTHLKIIEYGKN